MCALCIPIFRGCAIVEADATERDGAVGDGGDGLLGVDDVGLLVDDLGDTLGGGGALGEHDEDHGEHHQRHEDGHDIGEQGR